LQAFSLTKRDGDGSVRESKTSRTARWRPGSKHIPKQASLCHFSDDFAATIVAATPEQPLRVIESKHTATSLIQSHDFDIRQKTIGGTRTDFGSRRH
jgi:hypothetical protein